MTTNLEINQRVGWNSIGPETVAFNCNSGNVVIWNDTASFIWKMIATGNTVLGISDCIARKYNISFKQSVTDVTFFIERLIADGFVGNDRPQCRESPKIDNNGANVLLEIEMLAIKHLVPFAVTFETTYLCNEHCIHCYMDRGKKAMNTAEIVRILGEIANEGCLFVTFTGGEFFTLRDAPEILRSAHARHMVIDVLSNGTLINRELAELMSSIRLRRVQISLYGNSSKTHDQITRRPGSFIQTLANIELLREKNIKVEIAFTIMGRNFHELLSTRDLTKLLGCQFLPSYLVTARNNGMKDTFGLRVSDEQLTSFLGNPEMMSMYSGRRPFAEHQFYFGFNDILEAPPCYSGFNSCAITPEGNVLPCNQFLYVVGDLRQDSFKKIWYNSEKLKKLRTLKIRDLNMCSQCPLLQKCTRCPGLALLEGGDIYGISPENCRITKLT